MIQMKEKTHLFLKENSFSDEFIIPRGIPANNNIIVYQRFNVNSSNVLPEAKRSYQFTSTAMPEPGNHRKIKGISLLVGSLVSLATLRKLGRGDLIARVT